MAPLDLAHLRVFKGMTKKNIMRSSLLVSKLTDLISADLSVVTCVLHTIKSTLFLSFVGPLLSSGICADHPNFSVISDWL